MIRIVLLGRTGNILFQYALGRVLSGKHGVPLMLDASWYNEEGWSEVSHLLRQPLKARVVRRFSLAARALRNLAGGRHYWEYRGVPFLREPDNNQSFNPRFLDAPADCVLFGYFQTAAYFRSIEEPLRNELKDLLGIPEREAAAAVLEELSLPHAIAVHVRRTDYLQHAAFHVCDAGYYERAMDEMRSRVPGGRFFVFSDDPAWCRKAFRGDDTFVIDSGEHAANPLHDLHLMSLASHHIIANSSYSWWAAWLGKKPGQVVLMPDRWYAKDVEAPIEEKLCEGWEVVGTEAGSP